MKKKNHTLEELLRAAREESPVVSFSDTAEQIARLEAKRQERRGIAWLWERAFAFPNAAWKSVHNSAQSLVGNFLDNVNNAGIFIFSPLSTNLLRGASLAVLALMLFPALTDDMRLDDIHLRKLLPDNTSHQATAALVIENVRTKSTTTTSRKASNYAAYSAFTSKNTPNNEPSTQSTNAATEPFASESNTNPYPSLAEETRRFQERSTSEKSPSEKSLVLRNDIHENESKAQPLSNPANTSTEASFWQRLSVEARLASRTDIATNTGNNGASTLASAGTDASHHTMLDAASQQQFAAESASPLQNIALGVQFAVDEHHSIGLEGGTEPFLSALRPTSTFSLAQRNNPNSIEIINAPQERPQVGITSIDPPSTQPRGPSSGGGGTDPVAAPPFNAAQRTISAETRNRAWFGASYQYSFSIIPVLGGVQPLARLSVGGGEIGLVSRGIIGVRFLPQSHVSVLLAGEGTGIARQSILSENTANAPWEFAPRLGMTLGIAIKF
ncbi:MAG: hypothetical protein EAZ92_07630 [Candidatus Kapaibacterium sp.]|nr:MAG: hypothetical protein EAZ92_07630 [Candidatus Kapabacteria bacterium]